MSKQYEDLFSLPGVVGFGYGKKEIKGRVTKKEALVVFVQKKIPKNELKDAEVIPRVINDTFTDVIEIGQVFANKQEAGKRSNLKDSEIFYNLLLNYIRSGTDKSAKFNNFQQLLEILKSDLNKIKAVKKIITELDLADYKKATKSFTDFQVFLERLNQDLQKIMLIINVLSDMNVDVYKNASQSLGKAVQESTFLDKFKELLELITRNLQLFKKKEAARTSLVRPAPPGVSIGHYQGAAGTFGAVVYDQGSNQPLILSNNHVLANTSLANNPRAEINDAIVQPANLDGDNTVIGILSKYAPLNASPQVNYIDCALAQPLKPEDVSPEILEIGRVKGIIEPTVGMKIKKSGRTTGFTTGQIRAINATIEVNYGNNETLRFENQILATRMSEPGDSGSLVVDKDNKAVGLLFAGSDLSTIINPIQPVLDYLDVRFQ